MASADVSLRCGTVALMDLHQRSIGDYGGSFGTRDQGLLDSALNRPKHRWAYDEDPHSAADIAATYAVAIARNHPFVDGNKPTAFMAMVVFLALNGWALDVWQWKATRTMERGPAAPPPTPHVHVDTGPA